MAASRGGVRAPHPAGLTRQAVRAVWTAAFTTAALVGSGCAPSVCPTGPAQAASAEFSGIREDTVVALGLVIRYVDSPDLDSRGYDLDLLQTLRGEVSPEGTFLRVPAAIAGIRRGQAVMLIAEPAGGTVVVPGICVPLVPVADDEVDPG